MSTHAMIDLETLANTPDAVILSAAVVIFNHEWTELKNLVVHFDVPQQLAAGRRIDPATVGWWMGQDVRARTAAFATSGMPVRQGVLAIYDMFLSVVESFGPVETVWAKSPQFDCVLLETLARQFEAAMPWSYRQPRDIRTVLKLVEQRPSWRAPDFKGTVHDPLDDCRHQVTELAWALEHLGVQLA